MKREQFQEFDPTNILSRSHSQEQRSKITTHRKNSKEFVDELVQEIKNNLVLRNSMENFHRPSKSTEGLENYRSK